MYVPEHFRETDLARLDWLAARMNEEEVADERTQFAAMLQGDIRRLCRADEPGDAGPI